MPSEEESAADELVRELKSTRAAVRENTDAVNRLAEAFGKVVGIEPPKKPRTRAEDLSEIAGDVVSDVVSRGVSNLLKRRKK